MVQTRDVSMQRIQIGVVGLVIVLLFVSLASMLLNRAPEGGTATAVAAGEGDNDALVGAITADEVAPDEPLADLGVTPVVESEADAKAKVQAEALEAAPEQNNVETTEQ